MRREYQDSLDELWRWINSINPYTTVQSPQSIYNASNHIRAIAAGIQAEYPYYTAALNTMVTQLFMRNGMIHIPTFYKIYFILQHIKNEPANGALWIEIHPRIVTASKSEFDDQHYDSAAGKAIKEVEMRLRELFKQVKSAQKEPRVIIDCIGALLGENGALKLTDCSTESGKNYTRGVKAIFEGAFAAYRNPQMHGNVPYTKRESYEQIVLASQMMYVLERGTKEIP